MATMTMSLEGFEQTRQAFVKAPALFKVHASSVVAVTTFAIAQRARALVPVGEGNLKAAIEGSKPTAGGLIGKVGTSTKDVYYWRFVEFGTKHMTARPFFRPAAELESRLYVERLRAIGPRIERDLSVGRTL